VGKDADLITLMPDIVALEPLEHFLKRPSRDVGATQAAVSERWVLLDGRAQRCDVLYCEALVKMFDEIVQNACDNSVSGKKKTKCIRVAVTADSVTVSNDGSTIPIDVHTDDDGNVDWWVAGPDGTPVGQRTPEGVFTRFGSGANFNDALERQSIGTNGCAAAPAGLTRAAWAARWWWR